MITFRIRGRVVKLVEITETDENGSEQTTQIPEYEASLRIEVWDKDERFDDRLGSDKTDSQGYFEIQFTDEDVRQEDRELEWLPDIFFRVYRGSQLLGDTQGEEGQQILWNTVIDKFNPESLNPRQQLRVGETDYYIQDLNGWIIPEPDRGDRKPSSETSDNACKGQVVDILPTLDRISQLGRTTAGTPTNRTGGSLQQIFDSAAQRVLGRTLSADNIAAFRASLSQAFTPQESNGNTTYVWTPGAYTVQSELGGALTGAQASLYHRAKAALEQIIPLLDRLYALDPSADEQNMDAIRAIVRTEAIELVNEMGTQGGPRAQRVESLFQLLLGSSEDSRLPEQLGGQLQDLAAIFGLARSRINTVEEEQNYSNFLIIRDYLVSLRGSWNAFIGNSGAGAYVGTQLVLLSQALAVVAESVQETYRIMELVFLGPAERQAVQLKFHLARANEDGSFPLPDGNDYTNPAQLTPPMSVEELLSWVEGFATKEGPTLARMGGKLGVAKVLAQTADRLMVLVQAASYAPVQNAAFKRQGVICALRDLAFQLYEVKRLARELIPPTIGDRDADDSRDIVRSLRGGVGNDTQPGLFD
ncbi:MAG: hypothetical protein D6728_18325 [Cyanobacteria bacterium J055]|nr:MAG: hypothetical protein D6728_18325 [Cyanobacteria bacterium J055]